MTCILSSSSGHSVAARELRNNPLEAAGDYAVNCSSHGTCLERLDPYGIKELRSSHEKIKSLEGCIIGFVVGKFVDRYDLLLEGKISK